MHITAFYSDSSSSTTVTHRMGLHTHIFFYCGPSDLTEVFQSG